MKYPGVIDTRTWKMGHYPMPSPIPLTFSEMVEELREFHHYEAAEALELFGQYAAVPQRAVVSYPFDSVEP